MIFTKKKTKKKLRRTKKEKKKSTLVAVLATAENIIPVFLHFALPEKKEEFQTLP